MNDKPVEVLLFEFLEQKISESGSDEAIYGLELHDTIYQPIRKDRGLRISDTVGHFSPNGLMEENEYDVFVTVAAYSKVKGQDQQARQPAMTDVFIVQQATYTLLRGDSTLGGRVCESLLRQGARSYDTFDGEAYAVAIIPLVINPSGQRYAGE